MYWTITHNYVVNLFWLGTRKSAGSGSEGMSSKRPRKDKTAEASGEDENNAKNDHEAEEVAKAYVTYVEYGQLR